MARLLHIQASGWKAPFLEPISLPSQPAANPCFPVRAIRAEIPDSERSKPRNRNSLITWMRMGVPGGVTSDFAPGYVGGTPKGLHLEIQFVKGPNPSHAWCVNAPRIFTQQLPYSGNAMVLAHTIVNAWAEDLQRRALGKSSADPLLDCTPIPLSCGSVLHPEQPQITDGQADMKGSVDRLIRFTECITQLFLGEVPARALESGTPPRPPITAEALNASLCSWKGGYGLDFGPNLGLFFKGQLRFTVVTPDPEAYRRSVLEAAERAGLSSTLTIVGQEVHLLESFLVPEHPRFTQFK